MTAWSRSGRRLGSVATIAATLTLASGVALAQTSPDATQPAAPAPVPPAQVPTPGTEVTPPIGPVDPTRPVVPPPPVPPPTPGSIFIPPPTVPSVAVPPAPGPRDPGLPPAATFELRPTVGLTEEYSDNFNLTGRNRTTNFRTSLSPGGSLEINSPFTRGRLQYSLGAAHDSSDEEQRVHLFHTFIGHVTWEVSPRWKLSVVDHLSHTDEPSQADRLSLRRERRTFTQNTFSANSDYLIDRIATTASYRLSTFLGQGNDQTTAHTLGLTAGTSFYDTNTLNVGYEYLKSSTEPRATATAVDGVGASASEIDGHRLTTSFRRQFDSFRSGGVTGSYAVRNTEEGSGRGSDKFDLWSVAVFSGYSSSRLSFSGSLGYSRATTDSGGGDSSVTSTTVVTYRLARAVASIAIDSGFSETFAEGENFGLVQSRGLTASLLYPFTRAISASFSGFYRDNSGAGSGDGDRTTTTWGSNLSVNVRLTRWLGLVFDYAYTDTSSSGQTTGTLGSDYTENRARISLNAAL